jgi:hypothetical protein
MAELSGEIAALRREIERDRLPDVGELLGELFRQAGKDQGLGVSPISGRLGWIEQIIRVRKGSVVAHVTLHSTRRATPLRARVSRFTSASVAELKAFLFVRARRRQRWWSVSRADFDDCALDLGVERGDRVPALGH